MMRRIIVKFNSEQPDEEFTNAEVAVAQPGLFIIQSNESQLGMFPIMAVRAILFPDGPSRITEVTL